MVDNIFNLNPNDEVDPGSSVEFDPGYDVYVKVDESNRIIAINSSAFVSSDWGIKVDNGRTDRFHHAQGNYFPNGIFTEDGIPKYKLEADEAIERTEQEIEADRQLLPPTLLDLKNMKQEENKKALAKTLAKNPIQWTDGNYYGITQEDQQEMSLNMAQYQLAKQAGIEDATLEWHSIKSKCKEWSIEDFTALTIAVAQKVYPYLRHQETIKEQIYACQTKDAVSKVEINYENVETA